MPASDTCEEGCLPPAAELQPLSEAARYGKPRPFVGTGHPDTVLACPHGTWRLGDVLDAVAAEQAAADAPSCSETTKSGEPCKGRPGEDGRCAAHKES